MLSMLRRHAQSVVIQAMVLLIAVVFVFWGVGTKLNRNRNTIAEVNGREISLQDFNRSYERAVDEYRQKFGGQLPSGFAESIGLKQQVLGELIRAELLRQGGEQMGIHVSRDQVQKKIQQMKAFQHNGTFDLQRYKDILNQNRMTPTSFERDIRSDLLTSQVAATVGSFEMIPDTEFAAWLAYEGERLKIAFTSLQADDFTAKVQIKEGALAAWFEKNKDKYRSQPKIRLKYLLFAPPSDKNITIDNQAIAARYQQDQDKFRLPEQRHAAHILFKVTAGDDQATWKKKEDLAAKVLAQAKSGQDFAELAKKYSEGPSRDRGGDLGFFRQGQMVPAFDKAVFTMQPGEIRGPVRTRFGLHLIKLIEIKPARTRPLAEVRDQIKKELLKEQGQAEAFKRASAAYEEIMRAGSLDNYAKAGKEKVITTDFFSKDKPPKDLPDRTTFLKTAFSLHKGELSSLVELPHGYAILFVDDIQEPAVPELAQVRKRVEADYRREKSMELASEAAQALLKKAREKGGLNKVTQVKESDFVGRADHPDDVPASLVTAAFALPAKKHLPDKAVNKDRTFYLFEVIARKSEPSKLPAKQRKNLRHQLLVDHQNRLLNDWLTLLQAKAKIWTNAKFLQ